MNHDVNKAHTYGDIILSEEYDKRIERRAWLKRHKSKLMLSAAAASACIIAIAFLNL